MKKAKMPSVPQGLPARFITDSKDGFVQLCKVLEIANRSQQQAILGTDIVKHAVKPLKTGARKLPTARRVQTLLITFYGLPDARRELWRLYSQKPPSEAYEVPSLEYHALRGYDAACTELDLEDERMVETLTDFPGTVESITNAPEWQRPALAIWPDLRQDLIKWDTLPADRRDAVILAVFAVATILDDSRFLHWAADLEGAIAAEFAFARTAAAEEAEQGAVTLEESHAVATEQKATDRNAAMAPGGPPSVDMSNVIQKWIQTCAAVVDCAVTLGGDPPQPKRLPDLRSHVRVLEELHDSLVTFLDANRRAHLVATVADTVGTLADEHDAPWLRSAADQICAQWKLTWLVGDDVDVGSLRADVDRAMRALPDAMNEWRESKDTRERLKAKLQGIRTQPSQSLTSQLNTLNQEEELGKASEREKERMLNTLRVVAPEGHEFEQSRDYVRKWLDVTAGSDSAPADATPYTAQPQGVEDILEVAAEENKVESVTAVDAGDQDDSPSETAAAITEPASSSDGAAAVADELRAVSVEALSEPDVVVLKAEGSISPGPQFENAIAVLWQSVDERPGIAYHVARVLAEGGCSDPSLLPADLMAAAMLAASVQSADCAVVKEIRPIIARIESLDLSRQDARLQDAVNLMLFCATLRPALFAPVTGAASLLRRVVMSRRLTSVTTLAKVVADHAERLQRVRLDASLMEVTASTAWKEKFADLSVRVKQWRNKAGKQHILAQRVWMHWLQKDGCLGRLTGLIAKDDASAKEEVEQRLARFKDQKELTTLIKDTDHGQGSNKASNISGRALKQLQADVQPVRDLGADWLRLMDMKPNPKGFVDRSITALRRDLDRYGQPVLRALDACRTESATPLRAAAAQAKRSTDGLLRILDDDRSDEATDADRVGATPARILWRDLLYVTELNLNAKSKPTDGLSAKALVDVLVDTGTHAPTMSVACDRRLQRGNVAGAQLACDEMEKATDPEFDRCRSALDREVSVRKRTLIKKLAQLREDTEQAFCVGQLSDQDRNRLANKIVKVESSLNGVDSVDSIEHGQVEVGEIKQSIQSTGAEMIEQVKDRFQAMSADRGRTARERIEQCIKDGDLFAANELISHIDNNGKLEELSSADQDDPFREFMSTVGEEGQIGDTADDLKPHAIVKAAAERGRVAGVSFESLSQQEAVEAADLLTVWYRLSTARRIDDSAALEKLLLLLGFQACKQKTLIVGRGWTDLSVETDAIQDQSICPLPHFGSEAKGRYRLLLNWVQPVSESIARTIGSGVSDPTIIMHFGRLGPDREKLRQLAVTKQRVFLVIDESLVLYLSSRRSKRLSALFHCTLPFSAVEPYVTTSGLVPPELFYGRKRERQSIMNRYGSCFIYGGRQLGKTALLRSVEREFHNPGNRHLAKWIDLKVGEIGSARRPDEIWSLLWHELHDLPVLSKMVKKPDPRNRAHIDAMIDEIEQWINTRDDSRFLLLLDEADAFLAADATTDFRESTRLKGLMDRTDRRFKVVLAGLHNVLRTTKRSNHPLAHFGESICVGPLMTNGEREQAQKLVREPLRSVGCRFERDALGTRILAQTNYYPSLIQLYGAELVRQLRESTKQFPYVVTSRDVDAAYRDTGLRNAIRERFHWTLQLDPRYEVVAYALAYYLRNESNDIDGGVAVSKVAAEAKYWWPAGFDKTTDEQFKVLLDEMGGLGVLRSVENGQRYTLRNPNILLLLGNNDEIEQELTKEREVQDSLNPSTVHPQYRHQTLGTKHHAPLSHEQVGQLMDRGGITVIAGSRNGHIDLVADYLAVRESKLFKKLRLTKKIDDFKRALVEFKPQSSDVTNMVFVPPETPWTGEWLKEARRVLKRRKHGPLIRLVLLADPDTLWRVMEEPDLVDQVGGIKWCVIRPWHDDAFMRRWLDDNQLPSDRPHRRELLEVTGGWPVLLERFIKRRRNSEWKKRIEGITNELGKRSERHKLLSDFGIASPDVKREMRTLCDSVATDGGGTVADIVNETKRNTAAARLRMAWSERLGLVTRTGDKWAFNPLVSRLLADE